MTDNTASDRKQLNSFPSVPERSNRRSVLTGTAAVTATALAGCLGGDILGSTGAHDDVVLDEPEDFELLDNAEIDYPVHGEALPEATVPDLVTGADLSSRGYVGERHVLVTFIFTRCPGACPALSSNLLQVQANAAKNRYSDEVALMEYTFDPEYDTADRFDAYADEMGIDLDDGNWHFLRPETPDRAEEVIMDTFGLWYEELTDEQREEMEMHEDMAFQHENLILLVNKEGYVERSYQGEPPNPAALVEDVTTLRERW